MNRELFKKCVSIIHSDYAGVEYMKYFLDELDAELAKPAPKPVAWYYRDSAGNIGCSVSDRSGQIGWIPLYAVVMEEADGP